MSRLLDPNRDALPGDVQPPVPPPVSTATSTPRPIARKAQPETGVGLTNEERAYLQKFDERYNIDPDAARREQQIAALQLEEQKNMEAVNQFLLKERPQVVGSVTGEKLGQAIKGETGSSVASIALGVAAGFERIINIAPNIWNTIVRATGADASNLQATLGLAKTALDQQEGLPKAAGKMIEAATPVLVAGFGGAGAVGQAAAQVGSSLITAASADPEDSTLTESLRGTALEKVGIVGTVIDAVATHPDSTEPERRWKIFLEDLGLGAVVAGAVGLWRGARSTGKRLGDAANGKPNPVDIVVDEKAAARVAEDQTQRAAQAAAEGEIQAAGQMEFDMSVPELTEAVVENANQYVVRESLNIGFVPDQVMESAKKFDEVFNDTGANAGNVNFSESVARLARVIGEQPQGRGPMTFKQIAEMGEEYAQDVEFIAKALGREAGDIYNAEATSGVSQIINNLFEDMYQQAQTGAFDTPEGLAKFAEYTSNIERFMNILEGNASEQGRSLSMNASRARMLEAGDTAVMRQVENQAAAGIMLQRIKASGGVQEIRNMRELVQEALEAARRTGAEIDEMTGAVKMMSKFQRLKDGLIYYRTSNLLTSPFTTMRAFTETSTAMLGRQLQNINNAAITTAMQMTGRDTGLDPMNWSRAWNEFIGAAQAAGEGARAAWGALKTGKSNSPVIRADLNELRPTAIQIDESGKEGYGLFMSKVFNQVGLANDIAGRRLLLGVDSLMGTMTYRGYIRGVALQRAASLAGDAKAEFVQNFINNPPKEIHEAAVNIAQQMGNSNKPTGWIGKFVANPIGGGMSDHPVTRDIAKLLFPFGNTRGASLENGLAKFPVANLLVRRVRDDLTSGDPARVTKVISESMVGIEAMGIMWGLFESGLLTPVGTQDQRVLNQLSSQDGWKPGAIYVPGVGYKEVPNVQALQVPLRMASMLYQYAKSDTSEDELGELTATAGAVMMQMFNTTDILGVVGTIQDMVDAASAGDDKKFASATSVFTSSFATSFVPFQPTGRAVNQMLLDPEVKDYKSFADFTRQLEARIYATVPGLSPRVPPKRNIFGEPVFIQRGFSADYADVATEDKKNLATLQAMRELTDYASMIPSTVPLAKLSISEMNRSVPLLDPRGNPIPNMQVKLTPQEYDEMTFMAGQVKIQGMTLSEALHDMLIGGKASLDVGGNGLDTAAATYIKRFHKDGEMSAEAYGIIVGAINSTISRFRGVAYDEFSRRPDVRQRGAEQLRAADKLAKKNLESIITYGGE